MNTTPGGPAGAGRYEIRVDGQLDQGWSEWFDGFTLTSEGDGITTLTGLVVDQAALHGLLGRVRDLGVPLISVNTLGAAQPGEAEAPRDPPAAGRAATSREKAKRSEDRKGHDHEIEQVSSEPVPPPLSESQIDDVVGDEDRPGGDDDRLPDRR